MVNQYSDAFRNKDWALVTEMIHPEIFKYESRKNFEKALDEGLKEEGYIININGSRIDSVYPSMEFKGDKFALVKMTATISMMPSDDPKNVNGTDNRMPDNFCELLKELDDKYSTLTSCKLIGRGVEYNMTDLSFVVFLKQKNRWYFLSKDEESEKIVNKIIPGEVRRHFRY